MAQGGHCDMAEGGWPGPLVTRQLANDSKNLDLGAVYSLGFPKSGKWDGGYTIALWH